MPQCRLVDCTWPNTWKRPSEPAAPNVIVSGCTGADVSLPPSSPGGFGAGIQSMPDTNER